MVCNKCTTKTRHGRFFAALPFFLSLFPIILNHQGVKYNKALYHSICRLYLTGVLQVNILLAGEKWAYLKQMTLMNLGSWASITLFQLDSPAKHGYPTQICLTEGKIFSNSLCSQHLGPLLTPSLHLAFHKSINGRACHLFHCASLGNKLIIYQPIACPIALIKLEYK